MMMTGKSNMGTLMCLYIEHLINSKEAMATISKKGDRVKYEEDEYIVTYVWNHGGNMIYYDLEAKNDLLGTGYKRVQLSVHCSELQECYDV